MSRPLMLRSSGKPRIGYKAKPRKSKWDAMKVTDEMVDRFLSWPVPHSVCADLCATRQETGRSGTNLLSADEARQMLEHVLGAA